MSIDDLPTLNAALNAASAVAVFSGYICIKKKRIAAHKALMLTGVFLSAAFLTSYVIYHASAPPRPFGGEGLLLLAYRIMLVSHIILAVVIVPLVLVTVSLALRERLDTHRRVARWTFPIWMYVSVTGVLVYLALYVLPLGGAAS
jgi:uncharacterized membrane protein YozB (DUF420 family)